MKPFDSESLPIKAQKPLPGLSFRRKKHEHELALYKANVKTDQDAREIQLRQLQSDKVFFSKHNMIFV